LFYKLIFNQKTITIGMAWSTIQKDYLSENIYIPIASCPVSGESKVGDYHSEMKIVAAGRYCCSIMISASLSSLLNLQRRRLIQHQALVLLPRRQCKAPLAREITVTYTSHSSDIKYENLRRGHFFRLKRKHHKNLLMSA